MDRSEKEQLVTSLHETLKKAELVVITQQSGLTVAEVTNLRRQMRQAGAGFKVTKNRLARLALEGTKFEGLKEMFTGPTAIAYSADPITAAKVATVMRRRAWRTGSPLRELRRRRQRLARLPIGVVIHH